MISIEQYKKHQILRPAIRDTHLSGVTALDEACGGLGLVAGETVEWVGDRSCGKTGALRAFVYAARARAISVAWIDPFHQLMPYDWSERFPGHFWVVRPPHARDALICTEAILRAESFGLVILDGDLSLKGNSATRLQRLARKTNSCLVMIRASRRPNMGRVNGRLVFETKAVSSTDELMRRTPFRWEVTIHNERAKGLGRTRSVHLSESLTSRMSCTPFGADRSAHRTSHRQRYQG